MLGCYAGLVCCETWTHAAHGARLTPVTLGRFQVEDAVGRRGEGELAPADYEAQLAYHTAYLFQVPARPAYPPALVPVCVPMCLCACVPVCPRLTT